MNNMKVILPLFFFCVTLYLADGYSFLLHGHEDESPAYMYRDDWLPFRDNMMKQLANDMKEGKKGPVTILGSALLDTIILLLDDTPNIRSAEGQRRSDLSDLDFRDSSVSPPQSGPAGENKSITPGNTSNTVPVSGTKVSRISQENETNKTDEKCFARQILDLISLLVTNAYDEDIRKSGQPPTGPKMLLLLVNEINESLDTLNDIDILDATLFKVFKLVRRLLRGVIAELSSSSKLSPEMVAVVRFLGKLEAFAGGYIEADRAMAAAGNSVPAIRLLLDNVEDALEELAEGKTLTNGTLGSSLTSLRKFIGELRSTVELLVLGKWDGVARSSYVNQIFEAILNVLGQMIREMHIFGRKAGSFNNFILNVLKAVHARVAKIVLVETPIKRLL